MIVQRDHELDCDQCIHCGYGLSTYRRDHQELREHDGDIVIATLRQTICQYCGTVLDEEWYAAEMIPTQNQLTLMAMQEDLEHQASANSLWVA